VGYEYFLGFANWLTSHPPLRKNWPTSPLRRVASVEFNQWLSNHGS
jgi:hypothetical protein